MALLDFCSSQTEAKKFHYENPSTAAVASSEMMARV